jgi:hypothetical protein
MTSILVRIPGSEVLFLTVSITVLIYNLLALRRELRVNSTSLTLPLFIEVLIPSEENEQLCICVLEISILPLFPIYGFDLGTITTL